MRAAIVMLLCAGCSDGHARSAPETVGWLLTDVQQIAERACGECAHCAGDACDACLARINTDLGDAMSTAVGPLGQGKSIGEVSSFDDLALPADAKLALARSRTQIDTCYAVIRERRHPTSR